MNKKLLSIIALILVLCFAFVSCGEPDVPPVTDPCANGHTFESGNAWKFDDTMHWHEATCDHTEMLGDVQGHIDENIDGACDVCGYDRDHEHSFKDTYSFDATKHWQESNCYHKVTNNEGAHTPDVMGICTVCSYVVSDPDIDSVKDAIDVGSNQAGLVENGMVDTGYGEYIAPPAPVYEGTIVLTEQLSTWEIEGTYTFVLYSDNSYAVYLDGEENYNIYLDYDIYESYYDLSLDNMAGTIWWDFFDYGLAFYNADGNTEITELDGTITVEDEEGNVWATLVFDGEDAPPSDEPVEPELEAESMNTATFEFRDGYFYVCDNNGEYYYSLDANGNVFCAYYSYWDGIVTKDDTATLENLNGYQFPTSIVGGVDGIAFYGVEDLVKTLYAMASVDNINDDFEESVEEGYYKFSFGYYVADYEALYVIEVYFILAKDTYVFENVAVLSNVYTGDAVELLTEATGDTPATYGVVEGAVPSYAYYITALQNISDAGVENPYNPDTLLMKDYNFITEGGDIITDTITVIKGETLTLIFENIAPTTADHNFNTITFEGANVGSFAGLSPWYNVGEDFITINAYCDAGTYELTVIVNGYEKTFTVNVVDVPATEITAGVIAPHYNPNDGTPSGNKIVEEITELSVQAGSNKILAAYLDSASDSVTISITPDVTIFDNDFVNEGIIVVSGEDIKNIRSYGLNIRNLPVGEYTVTFTAVSDEALSKSIALTITEREDINGLEGGGTAVDPFIITELGDYIAQVEAESSVFFAYTATEDITIVLTSNDENRYIYYGKFVNLLADSLSVYTSTTSAINLTTGETLYIEVCTFNGAEDDIEFSLGLPSTETIDITGTYTATTPYQGTLTIVIDETTVTFTQGSYTVTFPYSMTGDIVTLYQADGVTPWQPYFYALTVSGGSLSSVIYNGNNFNIISDSEGGDDDDNNIVEEGTFYLTDNKGIQLEGLYSYILYDDNTVSLTKDGEPFTVFSIEYDGTYWVITSTMPGIMMTLGTPATLVDENREPITSLEGTAYIYEFGPGGFAAITLEFGATEGGDDNEGGDVTTEPDGSADNPYILESIPYEFTFVSDIVNKVYFNFTATESGYIKVIYPTDDSWADLYPYDDNGNIDGANSTSGSLETEFSSWVEAGKTYRLGIGTYNIKGEVTVQITFEYGEPPVVFEPIYEDVTVGNIDVLVHNNGYEQVPTYITFLATEDGTYTLSAANDEYYAQVFDTEVNWLDLPYVFVLREGESVTFAVRLGNYDLSEDTINLVLEKTAEYPVSVDEFDLQSNGEKVDGEITIEAGIYYYFDINIITPNASLQFATLSIAGENINADFDYDDMTAYQNCLMVEYDEYTNQILLKTIKAPAGTTFTFTITIDNAVNTYNVTVAPTVPTAIVAGSVEDWGWDFSDITEVTEITITAGEKAFIGAFVNRNIADDLVVYLDGVIVNANALISYEFYDNNTGMSCPGFIIELEALEAGTYTFSFASNANADLTASITVTVA